MKSEVVQQINVKFEKDDKELIKKVIALVGNLISTGNKYNCSCYEMNDTCYNTGELENLMELLNDLAYTEIIELAYTKTIESI